MFTLRIEHAVPDFEAWKHAFDSNPVGRERGGVRRYQVLRATDDPNYVMVDLDFDTAKAARGFLEILRTQVWPSPEKAPAKTGTPTTRIVELVESHEY